MTLWQWRALNRGLPAVPCAGAAPGTPGVGARYGTLWKYLSPSQGQDKSYYYYFSRMYPVYRVSLQGKQAKPLHWDIILLSTLSLLLRLGCYRIVTASRCGVWSCCRYRPKYPWWVYSGTYRGCAHCYLILGSLGQGRLLFQC